MMNQTFIMEFLLLRLTESRMLLRVYSVLFLLIYLVAIVENLIIILLTILDQHLHTPMYFFLRHLSFLDMCLISATVPKSILNSITFTNSISLLGCVLQVFLVVLMSGSEIGILTAMSYDCYIAICRLLHYEAIMSKEVCGFSCLICIVVCIVVSYVCIFSTVLKIPTRQKQCKAFSTCLPHLTVVSAFLLAGAIGYLKPTSDEPSLPDLLMSMFYSVVPPTLNPVIYCLRSKDIKSALCKVLWKVKISGI
ncbi:hypothetical protein PANDA_021807, partial [Ailuropoda melanoleuca]